MSTASYTYRDLLLYVLANNNIDAPVFQNGKLNGFLTTKETAAKFHVGENTVNAWISLNQIRGVRIGNEFFIPKNEVPMCLRERSNNENTVSNINNKPNSSDIQHDAAGVRVGKSQSRGLRTTVRIFDEFCDQRRDNL